MQQDNQDITISEKIVAAKESSKVLQQRLEKESEVRQEVTEATNEAESSWNAVYRDLVALWNDRRDYPGLEKSYLGEMMGHFTHSLGWSPLLIKRNKE